jgi:hypothetical protein
VYISACLAVVSAAIPLRAANRPHAGTDRQGTVVWTNDDLEKLRALGLISIVGQTNEDGPAPIPATETYLTSRDPGWYAEQAAELRDQLEQRQAQMRGYLEALADARCLKNMTGGINFNEVDIGITPEAGIQILQQRVNETQTELDALEDLARRNDIEPGTLRGH